MIAQGRLLPNLPSPGLPVELEEQALVEGYLARLAEIAGPDSAGLGFR